MRTMAEQLHIVTLGSDDVERAAAFWEAMGWSRRFSASTGIAFFQSGGMALALYPFDKLAEDCGMVDRGAGFGGFTLAILQPGTAAVDALIARMVSHGATLQKTAEPAFWGGYSGYVLDLDGHPWEIAYNPFVALQKDGGVSLPA
jgi:hypothetical protein